MSRKVAIASLIWGFSILLSRIIGLVREAVIGRVLGGGQEADLYFLAFTLPDFLYYLLAGGALSIVFIPIFSGHLARGDERRGWESFSTIANFILVLLAVLLPVLWFFSPALARLIGPGLDPESSVRLVHLTRIMLPAQLFHLLGGLLSAVLLAKDRHVVPALAPLVYTLGIIAGGLWPGAGAVGFAWGVLAGSVLGPFLLPLLAASRAGLQWRPMLRIGDPDLRAYLIRSLPVMLSFSVVAVDDWILRRLGSLVSEGAVSTLNYAKQLMKVPMGVFGFALAVAAFPTMSRKVAEGDRAGAWQLLNSTVRHTLVLALGAQVVLTCAGGEISRLLYGPRMDAAQHAAIGLTLAVLCLGLWGWAIQSLLARGFYALGNTWVPSLTGTLVLVVMYPLYSLLGATWGTTGLAAASAVAISAYAVIIGTVLRRLFGGRESGNAAFLVRIIPSVLLAVTAGLAARHFFQVESIWVRAVVFAGIGGLVYVAAVLGFRVREARALTDHIVGKIRQRIGAGRAGFGG